MNEERNEKLPTKYPEAIEKSYKNQQKHIKQIEIRLTYFLYGVVGVIWFVIYLMLQNVDNSFMGFWAGVEATIFSIILVVTIMDLIKEGMGE